MKIYPFGAATAVAFTLPFVSTAAQAQDASSKAAGHYEWQAAPQHGPGDPLKAPIRVWVSDHPASKDRTAARDSANAASAGHYVWKTPPPWGPRAPLKAPIRVWVPDESKNVKDMNTPR